MEAASKSKSKITKSLTHNVVNVLGKKISTIKIDANVFSSKIYNQSMFDLIQLERAKLRQGSHSTKSRAMVSGGGRKPWRQKGTGRARQGSIRSPQWRGGGVVFGPTPEKNYLKSMNKKEIKFAYRSGLTEKYKKGSFIILDNITFKNSSTKDFKKILTNLKIDDKKVLFILSRENDNEKKTYLSSRNLPNVFPISYQELLLDDILNSDKIFISKNTFELLEKRFA